MPIKSVKMKISKNKKMRFFLMSQGSLNPKIRFLGQKVWPVACAQTHRHTHTHRQTDRQTHRVTTEGTLSGFQDFFLQPIIKDRPNIYNLRFYRSHCYWFHMFHWCWYIKAQYQVLPIHDLWMIEMLNFCLNPTYFHCFEIWCICYASCWLC